MAKAECRVTKAEWNQYFGAMHQLLIIPNSQNLLDLGFHNSAFAIRTLYLL